jgi:hypothetical protein
MILELAQLLSTAHWILSPTKKVLKWQEDGLIYRKTHQNHPVAIWVRKHENNYKFVCKLALALCDEYYYRYGCEKNRQHASRKLIAHLSKNIPKFEKCSEPLISKWKITQPALAMPIAFQVPGKPITSYRNYYRSEQKSHLTSWKNRDIPKWFSK